METQERNQVHSDLIQIHIQGTFKSGCSVEWIAYHPFHTLAPVGAYGRSSQKLQSNTLNSLRVSGMRLSPSVPTHPVRLSRRLATILFIVSNGFS